ncbi:sugar nucleotide-binding protein [Pseudolysinimonas sp.]|uniref:sugar nucleotide-binding protein n=1 Tax=Pseudolysinimonas sp. TaxID=2680009 RepID=UPI003F81F538
MSVALGIRTTPIDGLLVVDLVVHGDARGWFKENWQRAKMVDLGLPDFRPVQQNVSYNDEVGVTRGIHAEPWNKLVSISSGRIFGAWVDLREGPGFGSVFTIEMGPETAVFVPRGVGNSYQTLEPGTAYSYLVDDHWSPDADYTFLNLADETVEVPWPIPLDRSIRSEKDLTHPTLAEVTPFAAKPVLVLGAGGQLGRALRSEFPSGVFLSRAECDVTRVEDLDRIRWRDYALVINAAGYTKVDEAENPEGRRDAWATNASAVSFIAARCLAADIPLVHFSSDYVFDGSVEEHREDEPLSPISVYGASKAAGDLAVSSLPQHWLIRCSWIVGDGKNFVRTMVSLAERGVEPSVVDDQLGRPTFAIDIARGVRHLVETGASSGTYNLSNTGDLVSWAEVARAVFSEVGADPSRVRDVRTDEYARDRGHAPRPRHSSLDLTRVLDTGFVPRDWRTALSAYLAGPEGD